MGGSKSSKKQIVSRETRRHSNNFWAKKALNQKPIKFSNMPQSAFCRQDSDGHESGCSSWNTKVTANLTISLSGSGIGKLSHGITITTLGDLSDPSTLDSAETLTSVDVRESQISPTLRCGSGFTTNSQRNARKTLTVPSPRTKRCLLQVGQL